MESSLKGARNGASVLDMDPKSTVGGGVEDVYGEDHATEDQLITPWTVSVARLLFNRCFTVNFNLNPLPFVRKAISELYGAPLFS